MDNPISDQRQQQQQQQQQQQTKTATTTSSKYIRDFDSLFVPIKTEQLRDKARSGNLKHCQFRSLCWRYFLHCLPEQYNQWLASCAESRKSYENIIAKHSSLKQALSSDDQPPSPPSTSSPTTTTIAQSTTDTKSDNQQVYKQNCEDLAKDSVKLKGKELEEEQQYLKAANQCDHKNVLRTIERDVVRTFPDMEFFRQTEMQGILERVLFHFASENTHLAYKQGMHELLATLLYVLHTDSQNCLINYQGGYANDTIASLLDLKYLEHDTYQLFSALMKSLETWYQNDEILTTTNTSQQNQVHHNQSQQQSNHDLHHRHSGHNNSVSRSFTSSNTYGGRQQVTSVLGSKLKMISENIVKTYDVELFNHLEALQIAPQIYGIRWMRLLFGREFEFLDLLTVWDAIICDKISMSLTNYIFASMLITIREDLVNGDYTDCLNNLMRHQFKDVQYVIKLALYLRNPKKHNRPKAFYTGLKKNFTQFTQHQHHQSSSHNRKTLSNTPETSLTSRLSQQYISVKQQFQQANSRYEQWSASSSQAAISRIGRTNRNQQQKHQLTNQQYPNKSSASNQISLPTDKTIKEYEMREMQKSSSGSAHKATPGREKLNLENIYGKDLKAKNMVNVSSESYEDLHSIVDYCWRLLSEQIDSLQRCLPKEKSLHSEDEIFVALAQLKKVRDVLKGSLRLEDELESTSASHAEDRK